MSHYAVLKLAPDAPAEVIRAAYRALAARHHPDRCDAEPGAVSRMQRVNEAYRVLSDPRLRAAHDAALRSGAGAPAAAAMPVDARSSTRTQEVPGPPAPRRGYAIAQYLEHARP